MIKSHTASLALIAAAALFILATASEEKGLCGSAKKRYLEDFEARIPPEKAGTKAFKCTLDALKAMDCIRGREALAVINRCTGVDPSSSAPTSRTISKTRKGLEMRVRRRYEGKVRINSARRFQLQTTVRPDCFWCCFLLGMDYAAFQQCLFDRNCGSFTC